MRIYHQQQPKKSRVCGQTCVAMVAGVDLETACLAVGHGKATTPAQIVDGLRALGVKCADTVQREGELPMRAMVIMKYPRGGRHWVVWWDGELFDPGATEAGVAHWQRAYVESFLPIYS